MKQNKMIAIAMMIALSAVLALVKIPLLPITTLAFDSLPGFVAAALFGPLVGGVVGALGHFFTALFGGFPMGAVSHMIIMAMMFVAMAVFGWLYRKGRKLVAAAAALVINGPVALVPFIFFLGWGVVVSMVGGLTIAAAVNIVLSLLVIPAVRKVTGAVGESEQTRV